MDWMIAYQDARRNMNDAEKIYANDKVSAQRIREENEKKKLSTLKQNSDDRSDQMDGTDNNEKNKSHTSPTHTREQRAKLSGVSSGTISRYDTVMKSGDDELKQSMLSGNRKSKRPLVGLKLKKIENQDVYNKIYIIGRNSSQNQTVNISTIYKKKLPT